MITTGKLVASFLAAADASSAFNLNRMKSLDTMLSFSFRYCPPTTTPRLKPHPPFEEEGGKMAASNNVQLSNFLSLAEFTQFHYDH